jgi:hypothetical protein
MNGSAAIAESCAFLALLALGVAQKRVSESQTLQSFAIQKFRSDRALLWDRVARPTLMRRSAWHQTTPETRIRFLQRIAPARDALLNRQLKNYIRRRAYDTLAIVLAVPFAGYRPAFCDSRRDQVPARGKNWTQGAAGINIVVQVIHRCLSSAGLVKHIIWLAVKIAGRNQCSAAMKGRAVCAQIYF